MQTETPVTAPVKRYALFSGHDYYPAGGWSDLVGTFNDPNEAVKFLLNNTKDYGTDWWHIIDLATGNRLD